MEGRAGGREGAREVRREEDGGVREREGGAANFYRRLCPVSQFF